MYLRIYGLGNTWLVKYLKSPLSEDHLRGNLLSGSKHCFNMNGSTFTKFIDHYEGN